jgi:hypothetical protein
MPPSGLAFITRRMQEARGNFRDWLVMDDNEDSLRWASRSLHARHRSTVPAPCRDTRPLPKLLWSCTSEYSSGFHRCSRLKVICLKKKDSPVTDRPSGSEPKTRCVCGGLLCKTNRRKSYCVMFVVPDPRHIQNMGLGLSRITTCFCAMNARIRRTGRIFPGPNWPLGSSS